MNGAASRNKPPYQVPSLPEIAALPWNGWHVASLFSGCGGSSLGYKMAGFKVCWANEFIPAAQATYRLNHPETYLDTRDIRQIQPADILAQLGMRPGNLDVLDGSPPCASFSTAGKRSQGWGKVKAYSDTSQRTDDLFFEYARILKGLQPKVFVAENVSGLVKGVAKGYFKQILVALRACGYTVEARLLDAQWLGVPQMRQRIIFVGVREDLGRVPDFPQPLPYRYDLHDALGADLSVPPIEPETDITKYANSRFWYQMMHPGKHPKAFNAGRAFSDRPCYTLMHTQSNLSARNVWHPNEPRLFSVAEGKRLCAFPDDFQLTGTYAQQWERLGRAVPPVMMQHIARTIAERILA